MKERRDYTERRQDERTGLQILVVGILKSGEPIAIGPITNISMSGVRCTYNGLSMVYNHDPIHSIDLIANGSHIIDIPCKYAWNVKVKTKSYSKLTDTRQCGIQFSKLSPDQIILLRNFINHCESLGINSLPENVYITYSE